MYQVNIFMKGVVMSPSPRKNSSSVRLMVNRQERIILTSHILYAQVADKLCSIFLVSDTKIHIFMSVSALKSLLPEDDFLEISRSCLVNLQYMCSVGNSDIVLNNGVHLPYSARRRTEILHAFQKRLSQIAVRNDSYEWKMKLGSEFQCFDRCPIPFFIVEYSGNELSNSVHFVFRYANDAFATVAKTPLNKLINTSIGSVFSAAKKRLQVFSRIAFHGGTALITEHLHTVSKQMVINCYQPHYGFCACLLVPAPVQQIEFQETETEF